MSKAYLVAGLGFGDEGKGTITQFLAWKTDANLVVRYNGGCQAAHNVYGVKDSKHRTFSQFGSATLEGVRTHLSRYMLVDPTALLNEGRTLISQHNIPNPYALLTIDRDALLITPYHWRANRVREVKRGDNRHGSCGAGVGETMNDFLVHGPEFAPTIGDLEDPETLRKKLKFIQELKVEEFKLDNLDLSLPSTAVRALEKIHEPVGHVVERYSGMTDILQIVGPDFLKHNLNHDSTVVFEGAQGVLLDQDFGFQPHTTWTDTTFTNARLLLKSADFDGEVEKIGVMRTYMTRHGAGPMPTEVEKATRLDNHNSRGLWQGGFRVGNLDLMLINYAIEVLGGVDTLAVTHLDQIFSFDRICDGYQFFNEEPGLFKLAGKTDHAVSLPVHRPADYAHQEKLTKALGRVSPSYQAVPPTVEGFIEALERETGMRVGLTSMGPTIRDKFLVPKKD